MAGTAVTCLKRMRLPLLAACIAMGCILMLNAFVFDTTARSTREESAQAELEQQAQEDKKEEKTLLFDQSLWDNIQEGDDWDAIFDSAAWSSLLNEGFVGANVKDEPPLPRFKKPTSGGAAVVPKDGAMKAKASAEKPPEKVMLSLGLGGSPSDVVSGKSKKKLKKAKKGGGGPPEVLQKFVPPTEETKVYEWFDTSYKQSKAFGKAKEFVEDEPLFGSCSKSLVAVRPWGETFLTLGPFRYLGRSKNPCWYPDNGGKFTCIPYFFLAGAAGPGTDDVMSKILIHPHVIGKKEQQHWWDLGRHAGVPWETYCQAYQEQTDQILLDINDHKSSDKVYGDSTATYFASPTGWERLSGNENCDEPRIILASHLRRLRVKGLVITVLPHPTRR
ncbi:uncharacterized protein [Littorina saxatilis]|uniref:Uncharacterized protein n=1 Tax=Littorina saxatilis TaxID=31220 RepID=A0AAN9AWM7_9CAEN